MNVLMIPLLLVLNLFSGFTKSVPGGSSCAVTIVVQVEKKVGKAGSFSKSVVLRS